MFNGGDIIKNKAFKHILSIGYELETNNLIKLTRINKEFNSKTPTNILLNTDSSQREINEILENMYNETEEDYDDREYAYRREEKLVLDVDKEDVSFHITNDMAKSPFIKRLDSICTNIPKDEVSIARLDETLAKYKDRLYKYKADDGTTYKINFLHGPENADCATFSDVEWVVTHYKPKLHSNVVLETFTDTIKYLLKHLSSLKSKYGEFIMNDEKSGDVVVLKRAGLYSMPKTNLRYFKPTAGGLESVLITIQMTFSAHVSNIFYVMKKLTEDNLKSYTCLTRMCEDRLQQLISVEMCVKQLVKKYNEKESKYKLSLTGKNARDKLLIRNIYNYMALMLYKLYIYYNVYYSLSSDTKSDKYFKNYLAMNARHNNYQLYVELKRCLRVLLDVQLFGKTKSEENKTLATIIKELFINHGILVEYLLKDKNEKLIRKNAFNLKNVLEKTDTKHYGDPHYSLVSYFDFFENPINEDMPDWFEHAQIDTNSTKMSIKDDVILVEFRAFPRMLSNYISSVLDEDDRDEMNRQVLGLLSIETLEKFIHKYNKARNLKGEIVSVKHVLTKSPSKKSPSKKNMVDTNPKSIKSSVDAESKPKTTIKRRSIRQKHKSAKKTRKFNRNTLQKQLPKN